MTANKVLTKKVVSKKVAVNTVAKETPHVVDQDAQLQISYEMEVETNGDYFGTGKTGASTMYEPTKEADLGPDTLMDTEWPTQRGMGNGIDLGMFI